MNLREASERVKMLEGREMTTVTRPTQALALKLAGKNPSFEDLEILTMAVSRESDRLILQEALQTLSESFGDAVSVHGEEYGEHEPGAVTYHSLCGPLAVTRSTYRQTGVRNGPTVVPLELQAALMERGTPALAKAASLGYAKHDLRGVVEDLHAAHRDPPSRATLDRMARRLAEHAHTEAPIIERTLRRQETLPEGAHGLVIGLDRGSVPMAETRPAGQPPATPRRTRTDPYERTPPPPFDVNWRMAPVATVMITDAAGDGLVTRKYAGTAGEGWDGIVTRAMADVKAALQSKPDLAVAVVQDGAHELWNITRAALKTLPEVIAYLEAIDRFHLNERLGKVIRIIEPDPAARSKEYERWQTLLDTAFGAIDEIEKIVLQAHGTLDTEASKDLWEHLVYLRNNKDRMRYVELRASGLPVGSGATESGCNTLLNLRVKRNAEHWSEEGLQGVLTFRGIHRSERFDTFWKYFVRRYHSTVIKLATAA